MLKQQFPQSEFSIPPSARHVVVQFDKPIGAAEREELRKVGLNLLAYLGENAFFASLAPTGVDVAGLSTLPFLAGVQGIERAWKQDPAIAAGDVPAYAIIAEDKPGNPIVALYVLFHPDVTLLTEGLDVALRHGAIVRDKIEPVNGLVIEMPLENVNALADEDAMQWMEWPLPRMSEVNNSNRARTQADIVQAAPYGLSGSGVNVLVYDAGTARSTHVDFQGRLTVHDSSGMIDHATHVAGTIGGAGVANAAYKGMAPAVTLLSYGFEYDGSGIFLYTNPGDLAANYGQAINTYGAAIANSSIGTNVEANGYDCYIQGKYGVTDQLIDTIVRGDGSNPQFTNPFCVVWSGGNERAGSRCDLEGYGDYYSIAPPAGAKNHITVGAVNSNNDSMTHFSSWGPTDDGRMKPDVCGPGCQSDGDFGVTSTGSASDTAYSTWCGTSMAAPTVCGCSALLLEDFRAQFPGEPDFRNSTLKILLAHTAVDLGNAGPDYEYGYGSVRIQNAVDFMRTGNFLENEVAQGEAVSFLVLVQPGEPELKVTLAWDDHPGTPNVVPSLVNDLDLRVFSPSSQQYYPWTLDKLNPSAAAVRTKANRLDNIEQVYVAGPEAGTWRIEVYGYSVPQGPQPFSLCALPGMVTCSSQGMITLDQATYLCSDVAAIRVIDCDLNLDDEVIETVAVTVASTLEPAGESVLLTETSAPSADFRGTIPVDVVDSAGVLLVAHGDIMTATYVDADDGQGHQNVTVTDTALVDCLAPVISDVAATNIDPLIATVTFNTDEPANGTVRYGLSCASLTSSAGEVGYTTAHSVDLTGLQEDTLYYYVVDAVDEVGNTGTNDNAGACFVLAIPDLPAGAIVGWGDRVVGVDLFGGFIAVAAGTHHSLGLKPDGSIVAWGSNSWGECSVPAPNTDFIAIAAGDAYSLGLKADGSIVAWGWNHFGQTNVPAPNSDFVAVAAGYYHSLGLKSDGSIVAWGINSEGQCNVPGANYGFIAVAGGESHSIGLKADGSVVAWGANGWGQCIVPAPNSGFLGIAAGGLHNLGLKADGSIVAWGKYVYGQTSVPAPNSGFIAVAAGMAHSLGLKADGSVVAWGCGYLPSNYGQCNVPAPNTDFIAVAASFNHSLGLKADGSIVAWGDNQHGQGNVPAPNTDFIAIDAGDGHSLGLRADRSVVVWGYDYAGQTNAPAPNIDFIAIAAGHEHNLGLRASGWITAWGKNDVGQTDVPAPNADFIAVAAGADHSLGLKAYGSIVAWGDNGYGQCDVPTPNTDFIAVAGGADHTLGLKADGSIVAWGDNGRGQTDVPAPNTDFIAVDAGGDHSLGLKADGSIVAWGWNDYGQTDVPAPNADFIAIAAGDFHNLGLKNDGSIVGWGWNGQGQCSAPVPNAFFIAVAAGRYQSLGIREYACCAPDGTCLEHTDKGQCVAVGGVFHMPGSCAPGDADGDLLVGVCDNCPDVPNPSQLDSDLDGVGDVCDNCPMDPNPWQEDSEADGLGDVCDPDDDNDGIADGFDNCPILENPLQEDFDGDGGGDVCDNCLSDYNPGQEDWDDDGVGNACDNCLSGYNPGQQDSDDDDVGDRCDNCVGDYNPGQEDSDSDGVGNVCDNCPTVSNPGQEDSDGDGIGDACVCFLADEPLAEPTVPDAGWGTRNRYLSFSGGAPGKMLGARVTLGSMSSPFEYAEGRTMWVGEPYPVTEVSGSSGSAPEPICWAAPLQCDRYWADWSAYGSVHVYDQSVIPRGEYFVQLVEQDCEGSEANFSSSLLVVTSKWGDAVGGNNATSPQGTVDFVDISAVVDKFKNVPGAPAKSRADVAPSLPDRIIDFTDIPAVVDAFKGRPYPYSGPPVIDPCP